MVCDLFAQQEGIEYINGFGRFADPHTIICTDKKGKVLNRVCLLLFAVSILWMIRRNAS